MKTERSTEVSALFDGELDTHEVRTAIAASLDDPEHWRLYGLIGDGLRGEPVDVPDMTASVMARIGEEPVVLAPRNLKLRQRHHPFLALAASVAGVAVVGWVALSGNPQSPVSEQLAAAQPAKAAVASAVLPAPTFNQVPQTVPQVDMSEYLIAHHAQASTGRLGDSTRQIRTVSMSSARP
jgi:sigma-E factor negative regulatory protein RseA